MLDVLHTSMHLLCRALPPQPIDRRQKLHLTQFRCWAHLTQLVQQGDATPARRAAALVAPVLQEANQTHRSAASLHSVAAYSRRHGMLVGKQVGITGAYLRPLVDERQGHHSHARLPHHLRGSMASQQGSW